jgi:hypothetical protein
VIQLRLATLLRNTRHSFCASKCGGLFLRLRHTSLLPLLLCPASSTMSSSATATVCTGPTHHATAPSSEVEDGDDDEARSAESKTWLGGVEGVLGGVEAHRRHRERDGGRTGLLLELYLLVRPWRMEWRAMASSLESRICCLK